MTEFLPLVVTLGAFIVSHMAISRPVIREPLLARIGRGGYGALHGTISTVGLVAVFWGFWQAPYIELWPPLPIFRAAPSVVMPLACILFIAGMTTPCAGLSGDRLPEGDNPAPGILGITRHPMPWALLLWAMAHVAANGDLAGVLFFGSFLVYAAFAPMLVDRRRRRCGEEAWKRFAAASPTLPFAGPGPIDWKGIGWKPVVVGLALYAVLLLGHEWVIGVQPWL
jgi:uncharacterized membrane protein